MEPLFEETRSNNGHSRPRRLECGFTNRLLKKTREWTMGEAAFSRYFLCEWIDIMEG